jgi:hypothetical protein
VMPQVVPGFGGGHRGHRVPDADPLVPRYLELSRQPGL